MGLEETISSPAAVSLPGLHTDDPNLWLALSL